MLAPSGADDADNTATTGQTTNLPISLLSKLTFRQHGSRRKAEAIFVPAGYSTALNSKKIGDIVKDTWKLPMPNMIVNCDAGSAHPSELGTQKLCQGEAFTQWASEANAQRSRSRSIGDKKLGEEKSEEKGVMDDETRDVINSLLYQKLVTVYAAILDAAKMSNNWIIVDRTAGSSPTAELLLEQAMAQTDT